MRRLGLALIGLSLVLGAMAGAPRFADAQNAESRLLKLEDEFIDRWLQHHPQVATRVGVHDYDGRLVPVTQASRTEDLEWFHEFQTRLSAVPRAELTFDRSLEFDVLSARVDRELLDLEVIRSYENNPNAYLEMVAGSIQGLLQRNFAPLCSRLRSATRRMRQIPEVLRAARVNLRQPPRIFTETAIGQYQGALSLFRTEVPAAAAKCKDPRTAADLAEADSAAVRALQEFIEYLRTDLLPRSTGDFAIGRETYQKRLACDEMEAAPVESLLARGYQSLDQARARMEVLAEQIAPGQGVPAALDSLNQDHPAENDLVPFVSKRLDHIRAFLREKDLITMPLRENLKVRETPSFRRSTSFASMESPGVWEKRANEAYYNVTPIEPSWSERQKLDHLAFFNRWSADIVSIHEALPGHYYQFLALQKMPSRVRQVFGAGSNSEGWAHYCEQMAIEEGFGGGDPRYELAQQMLAIQRIGRLIVGISLHTQGMSYDDAVKLFQERCYMAPVNAEREARRGTMDPTYLVYTLGKWHILDLRDEVRAKLGDKFKLKDFHDAFLRQGNSPLPVARAGLLHELGIADVKPQ